MTALSRSRRAVALAGATAMIGLTSDAAQAQRKPAWVSPTAVSRQAAARDDAAKETVAKDRARQLIAAMTLDQKMQQLTGSKPQMLPELPNCYGARHVTGIPALAIPTFRITNGPVGVGQNDCVDKSVEALAAAGGRALYAAYSHPSSAQATALPSAMAIAASFDPRVATAFGDVIATEMANLGLHVFEAPGVNLARLPILGRNFEYFGEDPFLSGTMAVAEIRAVQSRGLIAMAKHFVANEQETNRMTIQETVDEQVLREIYLIPFEMAVKDGHLASIMCSYNYVNGLQACENEPLLTGVLRRDWGFTGYVQSDFFAMKSTAPTLAGGMDHEMPTPLRWTPNRLKEALARRAITIGQINTALERRYTQMFKAGIFEQPLAQTAINFQADGREARDIGVRSAVLLQNNGALPIAPHARTIILVGKATQAYAQQAVAGGSMLGLPMGAGGGSSDVVPHYTVSPIDGIRAALRDLGQRETELKLVLVDDDNVAATIDGKASTFAAALDQVARADAVIVMAGTNAEEGADRATFKDAYGRELAASAAAGGTLDWYVAKPNTIATTDSAGNMARSSQTVAMLKAIMATVSGTPRSMAQKTVLVLKDNAGVAINPSLIGAQGPSMLEVWFPGQEDGNIVADLLFGRANPSGKLPVTFPIEGRGFLDAVTPQQFPGVPIADGKAQSVTYSEKLNIGYRWYDANASGSCAEAGGRNPCVAFAFGHGLSYASFAISGSRLMPGPHPGSRRIVVTVKNTGLRKGAQVVQAYVSLPHSAGSAGSAQPPKRLIGFEHVDLEPGASQQVSISIDPTSNHHPLSVWDKEARRWVIPAGTFIIRAGVSSSPADLVEVGILHR